MSNLVEWSSFYVIAGTAAGALIGLQFVVMTLIANKPALYKPDAGAALATPTIVHFGVVLLLSAAVCVPWHEVAGIAIAWGLVGGSGVVYSLVVVRGLRLQSSYQPVLEDWLFHALLPFLAYAVIGGSGYLMVSRERPALFGAAAATLLLLFVGIHNAWDAVTYHVFVSSQTQDGG